MLSWVFKKFLCPKDIHKVVEKWTEVMPKDKGTNIFPRRFCKDNRCEFCGKSFESHLPTYEDVRFEETIIYGKDPFIIRAFNE